MNKFLKLSLGILLLSTSLNSCGKKLTTISPMPSVSQTPIDSPIPDDYYSSPNNGINNNFPSTPTATPNTQAGTFKVDDDLLNDWQAKGIAVSGGTIYISASDSKGLSKKGTIIKMNASDGKSWKDLASSLLGMRHPMDATVTGVAISGGTIVAADSTSKMYIVDSSKGSVKVVKSGGGLDVAAAAGSFFVSNGTVEKTDAGVSSRSPINSLSATGGIGADSMGNVYAVSGVTVKKADMNGQITDIVTTDLSSPIDVAVDNRNGDLYVLETSMIKRFNTNGQLLSQFSNGATKPISIAVDETGSVYVADSGTTAKDSKIVKFSAAIDNTSSTMSYNDYSSLSSGNDYSSYSTTKTTETNSRLAGRQ